MKLSEFKSVEHFCNEFKKSEDKQTKSLASIMPTVFSKFPYAYVRDYLDVDGTFAVVVNRQNKYSVAETIDLFSAIIDVVGEHLYYTPKDTGIITDLDGYEGFWILFQ